MKRLIIVALAVVAGAIFNPASAGKKKDKKKKTAQTEAVAETPVVLSTAKDSVSYAAGMAATNGLMPYLQQQFKVDSAHVGDFITAYEEAITKTDDPKYNAMIAAAQIAQMSKNRIFPSMNQEFKDGELSMDEEMFQKGFVAALKDNRQIFTDSAARAVFEGKAKEVRETKNAAYKKENADWLTQNATKEGVVTLPSGLQYKVLVEGTGAQPKAEEEVEVKYEGKLIDGTVFDSSYKRNPQTAKFRCNQVIKGWTEALTMMPVGSKWELYIPQELAYGDRQAGKINPYSTLIFTVELLDIVQPDAKAEAKEKAKAAVKKAVRKKK